jgi:peptidoglycan/xylan/chitin deacetylase (PgdA/CDA1 family)
MTGPMSKEIIWAAIVVGALGAIACWPHRIARVLRIIFKDIIWTIDTSDPVIAITFDDGPDPEFTPKVLDVLRRYNVKATFFLVGERVRRFPELVQQIREEEHGIGNHSDSWRRTVQLSNNEFERDLLRAENSVGLCNPPKLFRPAGAMIRPSQIRLLRKHNYLAVLGSAYAFDPYRPPSKYIEWVIGRGLRPGAIIVLHDSGGNRSNTVEALPAILLNAQKARFKFVKLSEYISRQTQ